MAQEISFFHLSTTDGLSDNLVTSVVRDKSGLLWVATAEGLNSYDGFTVKKYYKEDYPELNNNNISSLFLDDHDRIWLRDVNGKIILLDEKRKFVPVPVLENGKEILSVTFFETRGRGICVMAGNKIFEFSKTKPYRFEKIEWAEDSALIRGYVMVRSENSDTITIIGSNKLCVFDAVNLKVLHTVKVPQLIAAAWLSDYELLVTTQRDRELLKIDLHKEAITHNYGNLKDQYGENINGYLRHMRRLPDGRFIISSAYAGMYIFDAAQEKMYRYGHDPLNVRSISADNTQHVFTDKGGYVYITTRTSGINYFNIDYQAAGYRNAFMENSSGKIFHGYINSITRHRNGNFWLGTQNGLIEWNREINTVKFHEYGMINNTRLNGVEEVRALLFDKQDRLWVGLNRYGLTVLDKNKKVIKYISADTTTTPNNLRGNWINSFTLSPDNKIWVATSGGLCIIHPEKLMVEKMDELNALKPLEKIYCYSVWFRNNDEVWIATSSGAYQYIKSRNRLIRLYSGNGLSSNAVYSITGDKNGTVYIGTNKGLNLVRDTTVIKIYGRQRGLVNDRCYGMMPDTNNNIWIGNDNTLLCYNSGDSSFKKYDESAGLNPSGYRTLSFYQSPDGEQFWGSDLGLSYFRPRELIKLSIPFSVYINSFTAGNETIFFPSTPDKIKLPYAQNNLIFGFTAVDLYSSKNIIYEYTLDGADKEWKRTYSPQQVVYSKLSPGAYTFYVRASKDGSNWIEASGSVSVIIKTPWWRNNGFIIVYVLALAALVYYYIRSRSRKIKEQKEQLETEQAINYFATSMTGHQTTESTLWDVAKNCIGKLGFEDCVIYLKDEQRNVLIQKAAWGPKTTDENKIINPIEIPVGRGIVGSVAHTGKAEIVNDTSKDERYIVDDVRRFSEIAVPVISDDGVLGVIDSEHPEKNFFTAKHLSILTTIASLCANKIILAKAEEEKRKAEKHLLETQRQTAEMEMQALRAQMNPHFMFNSLNSINNFILKNDPDNASQYLTRFSRLMRLILDNSREEWVLLENELKAIQLYIEMEAIRFDNVFDYKINTAIDVNPASVIVPPMIVQPYVENAIWHGLLHREKPGSKLQIDIWKNNDELFIRIEDNGVGRQEAEQLKSKFSSHKKSHGMKITAKRLDIVNKIYNAEAYVKVSDLKNSEGKTEGTSVLLQLKYKTSHNS